MLQKPYGPFRAFQNDAEKVTAPHAPNGQERRNIGTSYARRESHFSPLTSGAAGTGWGQLRRVGEGHVRTPSGAAIIALVHAATSGRIIKQRFQRRHYFRV